MKFVKLVRDKNRSTYKLFEFNDYYSLITLCDFFTSDGYFIARYLDWLRNTYEENITCGNRMCLVYKNNLAIIRNEQYYTDEERPEEDRINEELCKFETTKEKMLNIFKQWILVTGEESIENSYNLPANILFTLDENNEVKISVIDNQDSSFSRLLENNQEKYVKLERSSIFENYIKSESNHWALYKLGIFLNSYSINKELVQEWVNSQKDYCYLPNLTLKKDNNLIYIKDNYNEKTRDWDLSYQIKIEDFVSILNQWEQILKLENFPEYVLITEKGNELNLTYLV